MSHSKRNTSRPVFTSYERALAQAAWASSSARLTRDSFLPFASCCLCLHPARDPVACPRGDIFCRECALTNIVAQKQEMKRAERMAARADKEAEEEMERRALEEKERAVLEFERTQQGLCTKQPTKPGGAWTSTGPRTVTESAGAATVLLDSKPAVVQQQQQLLLTATAHSYDNNTIKNDKKDKINKDRDNSKSSSQSQQPPHSLKRKFELDADELLRIAQEDRARARVALDAEHAAANPKLPSFWVPSATPSHNNSNNSVLALHDLAAGPDGNSRKQDKNRKKKTLQHQPICPASSGGDPHVYALNMLVTVRFTESDDTSGKADRDDLGDARQTDKASITKQPCQRVCPACMKVLSNASRAIMAKPCGHVLCKACVDQFMLSPDSTKGKVPRKKQMEHVVRCFVCDEDVTERNGDGDDGKKPAEKRKSKVKPGLVSLRSEGTGFSAGGSSVISRTGIGFQA